MSKYAGFISLLNEQVKSKQGLPDIVMTNDSNLRDCITSLVSGTESSSDVELDKISVAVEEYEQLKNNQLTNSLQFDIFQRISDAFATKLNDGITELQKIKKEVSELTDKINDKVLMRIAEDAFLSEVYNIDKPMNMDHIHWDELDNIGVRSVIAKLHDVINHNLSSPISRSTITVLLNKIPFANERNGVELKSIELNKNKYNTIANKICSMVPDYPVEFVRGALRNIFNLDSLKCKQAINSLNTFADCKGSERVNDMIKLAACYSKLLPLLTNDVLDLSESSMAELNKHIGILQQITDMTVYICEYYRSVIWKDAILVPGPLYNTDTYTDFEQQGGSLQKLYYHNTEYYKNMQIPKKGVSGKYVLETADRLIDKAKQRALVDFKKAENIKNQITREEFILNAGNWLNKNKSTYSKEFFQSDPMKFAMSVYDSAPSTPVTSKCYNLIMGSCHIGSMEREIYNRLSLAYVNKASSTESLSEDVCNDIETTVYADMISEYMVERGILLV